MEAEERIEIERSVLEFKQQVRISPMNLFVTDLWDRLFTPGYIPVPAGETADSGVFFPDSPESFAEMAAEFEREEAERQLSGVFRQET